MEVLDIHHSRERVEWTRVAIQKRFSAVNSKVAADFLDRLRLENKSWGRIENYGSSVIRILAIRDDKKISNWTRKDIESIHIAIANASWASSTKKDTLTALKRLYHFARHGEIADKARDKDYDDNVAWITPSHFRDRYEKIQSKDLLTDAELENLFKAVKEVSKGRYVKRNVAALLITSNTIHHPRIAIQPTTSDLDYLIYIHTMDMTGTPNSYSLE